MYLITYPVGPKKIINHEFIEAICTKKEECSKEVLKLLVLQYGEDKLGFYNLSDMEDCQILSNKINDPMAIRSFWSVILNIDFDSVKEFLGKYQRDFVRVKKETMKCVKWHNGNQILVYGNYEEAVDDLGEDEELYGLITIRDEDNLSNVEVYKMDSNDFGHVLTLKVCENTWYNDVQSMLDKFLPEEQSREKVFTCVSHFQNGELFADKIECYPFREKENALKKLEECFKNAKQKFGKYYEEDEIFVERKKDDLIMVEALVSDWWEGFIQISYLE